MVSLIVDRGPWTYAPQKSVFSDISLNGGDGASSPVTPEAWKPNRHHRRHADSEEDEEMEDDSESSGEDTGNDDDKTDATEQRGDDEDLNRGWTDLGKEVVDDDDEDEVYSKEHCCVWSFFESLHNTEGSGALFRVLMDGGGEHQTLLHFAAQTTTSLHDSVAYFFISLFVPFFFTIFVDTFGI